MIYFFIFNSQSPPPAALEFLSKIREVITIAKYKMASKRYQPSLIMIPEEHPINWTESCVKHTPAASRANSVISIKDSESRKKACSGCPGCNNDKSENNVSNCKNCGEKRNSIRKWLEGVSKHENEHISSDHETEQNAAARESNINSGTPKVESSLDAVRKPPFARALAHKLNDSSSSSDSDTVKANSIGSKCSAKKKSPPPPLPSSAPKIISHFLKRDVTSKLPDKPMVNNAGMTAKNNINNNSIYVKTNAFNLQPTKMFDGTDIYNSLSITGSEIYNNPQFMLNSPPLSQRSRNSKHSHSSRSARKRMEVMDQYSNPMLIRQKEMLKNLQKMPDMVYEAIANDYSQRNNNNNSNDRNSVHGSYGQIKRLVPTPDYDDPRSTLSSVKQKYANVSDDRYIQVPTPDYTLARNKNGKPYQPDSPIYHRKSPHYLIVDYETDSLERSHTNKLNRNSLTPHSNNSSDLSSQPSPSLSSALPLEEEVEIRNAVYDRAEGFRKDGDPVKNMNKIPSSNKSLYEEVGSMSSSAREPRIRYNTPFHGSMTIEVEHSPTDTEVSTDSDQFEPDTLDRKPKKLNNAIPMAKDNVNNMPNNQKNINAWNNHLQKSSDFLNQADSNIRYSSLENMTSLPDMKYMNNQNVDNQVVLRSSGSFKSNSLGTYFSEIGALMNNANLDKSFCSLREIYEAKNQKNLLQRASLTEQDYADQGRLLTLEARHSKRQRPITLEKKKKPMPPDIIPLGGSKNIYDVPANMQPANMQPVKTDEIGRQKNLTGWNTDEANRKMCNNKSDFEYHQTCDSTSNSSNSESTDVTGVSDTLANSEHETARRPFSQVERMFFFP